MYNDLSHMFTKLRLVYILFLVYFLFLSHYLTLFFLKKKFFVIFFKNISILISWHESWVLQVNMGWFVFLLFKLHIYCAILRWFNMFFLIPFYPILYLERFFYKLYGFLKKKKKLFIYYHCLFSYYLIKTKPTYKLNRGYDSSHLFLLFLWNMIAAPKLFLPFSYFLF